MRKHAGQERVMPWTHMNVRKAEDQHRGMLPNHENSRQAEDSRMQRLNDSRRKKRHLRKKYSQSESLAQTLVQSWTFSNHTEVLYARLAQLSWQTLPWMRYQVNRAQWRGIKQQDACNWLCFIKQKALRKKKSFSWFS